MKERDPFYVYVAGPLSDDPPQYLANVAVLTRASRELTEAGYTTINPAADLLEGLMSPKAWPLSTYQERSTDLMRLLVGRPGCVYVVLTAHADSRTSAGVAAEIAEANRIGIPVCYSRSAIRTLKERFEGKVPAISPVYDGILAPKAEKRVQKLLRHRAERTPRA